MKPKFFVFEGIDGCGKTTQLELLAQKLGEHGIPHIATREPNGGNPAGKLARAATHGEIDLTDEALALIFAADRSQHIRDVISPALKNGEHVLCDRYYFSNLAYQTIGGGLGFGDVAAYNRKAIEDHKPDLTFFIDEDVEECLYRIWKRSGKKARGIYENAASLESARKNYLRAFEKLCGEGEVLIIESRGKTIGEISRIVYDKAIDLINPAV